MTRARLALALLLSLGGCRGLQENQLREQHLVRAFEAWEPPRAWQHLDEALLRLPRWSVETRFCPLCLVSAETRPGARRYCVASLGETSCFQVLPTGPASSRLEVDPDAPSGPVRELWRALDAHALAAAARLSPEDLEAMAAEAEARFEPRFTFLAGAKAAAVVSYDVPTFAFGAQAGVRYWGSPLVIPGAALELDNNLQGGRSFATVHPQGRVELSLWDDRNARLLNLPRISFLMGGGPLLGIGQGASLGGRAVVGLHLGHLGRVVTPFFFELGFQALEVDAQSSTGLRVALGVGF